MNAVNGWHRLRNVQPKNDFSRPNLTSVVHCVQDVADGESQRVTTVGWFAQAMGCRQTYVYSIRTMLSTHIRHWQTYLVSIKTMVVTQIPCPLTYVQAKGKAAKLWLTIANHVVLGKGDVGTPPTTSAFHYVKAKGNEGRKIPICADRSVQEKNIVGRQHQTSTFYWVHAKGDAGRPCWLLIDYCAVQKRCGKVTLEVGGLLCMPNEIEGGNAKRRMIIM